MSKIFKQLLLSDKQMSEAFINNIFLALSGGLQDAYTYNCRDGVFSNAQTGNIVLMCQHFMERKWWIGLRYLIPVIAFAIGVMVAENIQHRFRDCKKMHWRQGILIIEIIILIFVGFIPSEYNIIASILVSFTCAMQVQTFRKIGGYAYASTMCIGNLRSGTVALSEYLRERKPEKLRMVKYYFGIIFVFAIGAGLGGVWSVKYGLPVIWISGFLLTISFLLMSLEKLK